MNFISNFRAQQRRKRNTQNEYKEWRERQFASPSPSEIKRAVLLRHGTKNATWVETGTFMGETSGLLATHGKQVYTIEPEPKLFAGATERLKKLSNVEVIHGTSEEVFPKLLPRLSGAINFWLDGHYSGGLTFEGVSHCPVKEELKLISSCQSQFTSLVVMIDDIRCFQPDISEFKDYPSLDELVDWARSMKMSWTIEHDIFIARNCL